MCIPPRASSGLTEVPEQRTSDNLHVGNLHGLLGRWAEPERRVQDGHVVSRYLDDLKDGHLHDLFFCAFLHGLEQENLNVVTTCF